MNELNDAEKEAAAAEAEKEAELATAAADAARAAAAEAEKEAQIAKAAADAARRPERVPPGTFYESLYAILDLDQEKASRQEGAKLLEKYLDAISSNRIIQFLYFVDRIDESNPHKYQIRTETAAIVVESIMWKEKAHTLTFKLANDLVTLDGDKTPPTNVFQQISHKNQLLREEARALWMQPVFGVPDFGRLVRVEQMARELPYF